ncbi:MAG: VOC family protein [Halothiobacillaceae bacterium]|nr:MAG: VOC family protein [Halothiobacillaceae bacterium]
MIASLDHLVLTVRDLNTSAAFYQRVLGMQLEIFGEGRMALHFGAQKINLHPADGPYAPHATAPLPGSADLCFLSDWPLDQVLNHLDQTGIAIEQGPVRRSGANGPILSVYIRDPDGNLLEIAQPLAD